jgi:hypothetical protein
MSASLGKRPKCWIAAKRRDVPITEAATSFDHFVREREECLGNGRSDLELLDRDIAGLVRAGSLAKDFLCWKRGAGMTPASGPGAQCVAQPACAMPVPITVKQWQTVVEIPSLQLTCGLVGSPGSGVHVECGPWAEQDSEKPPAVQLAVQSVTGASVGVAFALAGCATASGA